jgi:hypothetical protein
MEEPPRDAQALARALCDERIVSTGVEVEALRYARPEVVRGMLAEQLQQVIHRMEEKSRGQSSELQQRLQTLAETSSEAADWSCVQKARAEEIGSLDFADAHRGRVPTWMRLVCMLDAHAKDLGEKGPVRDVMNAWCDAMEVIMQDSAYRLAELAVSTCEDGEQTGETTVREELSRALSAESGWIPHVERAFLRPMMAAWRDRVLPCVDRMEWFGGKESGQHQWRVACACFGWLNEVHRALSEWHRWYTTMHALVVALSSVDVPAALHPEWMDPCAFGWMETHCSSMSSLLKKKHIESIILTSLERSGMQIARQDQMDAHPWKYAAKYMFAEMY